MCGFSMGWDVLVAWEKLSRVELMGGDWVEGLDLLWCWYVLFRYAIRLGSLHYI